MIFCVFCVFLSAVTDEINDELKMMVILRASLCCSIVADQRLRSLIRRPHFTAAQVKVVGACDHVVTYDIHFATLPRSSRGHAA